MAILERLKRAVNWERASWVIGLVVFWGALAAYLWHLAYG